MLRYEIETYLIKLRVTNSSKCEETDNEDDEEKNQIKQYMHQIKFE